MIEWTIINKDIVMISLIVLFGLFGLAVSIKREYF